MEYSNPLSSRERQTVAQPFVSRRRYIDLTDYLPTSDLEDCFDGVQAAFNDGENREIVVSSRFGEARQYLFSDRTKGRLTLPNKSRIIWEEGNVFDFSGWGRNRTAGTNFMERQSELLGTVGVTTSIPSGASTFSVSVASPVPLGYVLLQSTELFTTMEGTIGTKGEWVYVVRVSGTTVEIAGCVTDNYFTNLGSVSLSWFNMASLTFENIQVRGPGTLNTAGLLGDRAVRVFHSQNSSVLGGNIFGCDNGGIEFVSSPKGLVDSLTVGFERLPAQDRNQYGITHSGTSQDWTIQNSTVLNGKEAFSLSNTGGAGIWYYYQGVSRNIKYIGNTAKGAWRSGYCTHHNHENIFWFNNLAEDCEQGIDIRIKQTRAQSNTFRRMGRGQGNLDCGIQLASGAADALLEGNYYEDCLRGIYMSQNILHESTPGDYVIRNETMRGERLIMGVDLAHAGSAAVPSDALLGTVTIEGLDFAGRTQAGSGVTGVRLRGKWNIPKVQGRIKGGTGSTAVSMSRGPNSTAADGGSVSPMVDVEYTAGYTYPTLLHTTGVAKTTAKGIGFNTSDE